MGRAPRFEETGLKKGPWTPEEDQILLNYIRQNGPGSWRAVPKLAGLRRCGKSCRLRWTNYLRPDIKRGPFTQEEERIIILLHVILGSRWSVIASQLPGRTDNEIKNFWNTHLKKRLLKMGFDPSTHAPRSEEAEPSALLRHKVQWENARLEAEARLSRETQVACSSTASYQTNSAVEENVNAPADYFFKVWNSHAGEAFRRESSTQSSKSSNSSCDVFDLNWVGDNQVSSTEIRNCKIPITSSPVSSFCPASTDHSFHHSLNPNDKAKENDSQRCNSGSANWIGDCGVITIEANSSTAAMSMDQTEHIKAPEGSCSSEKLGNSGGHCADFSENFLDFPHIENKCSYEKLGHSGGHCTDFSEIFLDFPHIENNNNRIGSMITELSSQEHSAWPWPEFHLEDDEDDCGNVSGI